MAYDRAGAADDPQRAAIEVAEHLAPAAGRVGGLAQRMQKDIERRLPKREGQRHITVIWHDIVAPDVDRPGAAELRGLMAGRGDHEMNFALAAEQPQPVVDRTGAEHAAQRVEHLGWRQFQRHVVERERGRAGRGRFFAHSGPLVISMGQIRSAYDITTRGVALWLFYAAEPIERTHSLRVNAPAYAPTPANTSASRDTGVIPGGPRIDPGNSVDCRLQIGSSAYQSDRRRWFKNTVKSRSPGDWPYSVSIAAASLRCWVPWFTTCTRQCHSTRSRCSPLSVV